MATKKPNPFAKGGMKGFEKSGADKKADKKTKAKEGSKKEMAMDKKGMPPWLKGKAKGK